MIPEVVRGQQQVRGATFSFVKACFLGSLTFFSPWNSMLSKLSLTFYSEFLRASLHKINSADLIVIKTILDVPEMSTMCGLVFFPFHSVN